jgi:inner membrane protein involved in colicin E2 resistance
MSTEPDPLRETTLKQYSTVLKMGAIGILGLLLLIPQLLVRTVLTERLARRNEAVEEITAGLTAMFGFLFVLLRLQDYSLLIGTFGLFLVLAFVMFVTRNIDWYSRDKTW